ncbi:glycoside hydrolase family 15 [Spirillospora sp. NBC_01491]
MRPGRVGVRRGPRGGPSAASRRGPRRVRRAAALLLVAVLVATCGAGSPDRAAGPGWASPGLVGGGGWPFNSVPLSPAEAEGASYLPDSSVVRLGNGRIRFIPFGSDTPITVDPSDPRVAAAVRSDSAWLARGTVPGLTVPDITVPGVPRPGATGPGVPRPGVTGPPAPAPSPSAAVQAAPGPQGAKSAEAAKAAEAAEAAERNRDMAARALLDLRLLTRPNGASLASWYGPWNFSWPRDSAFAAAAFAVSGHPAEGRRVLRFMARVQHEDGLWAARYNADGTAVADGRPPQLDSLGWVLWASWFFRTQAPSSDLPELWPMVRRAADRLARSLDSTGLPPPSSDYWERGPGHEQDPDRPTLGVVGPVLAGLRSAAAIADGYGKHDKAARWRSASHRLSDAVGRDFAPHGYPRSPIAGGLMDTSVTFLGPPFGPADPAVDAAVANAARKQALPNGGVLPGERWSGHKQVAWTPEMALFTLSAATSGRTVEAHDRLGWLAEHSTSLGALPEKVGERGQPAGVAPLGWTASLVVLSLAALERPLPVPPA